MPLKPHPTDPDKLVYTRREYDMTPTPVVVELRRLERINAQLLEALEALVGNEDARSWGVFGVDNRSAFTKARAAIAAAKGGS
jgi:hypothetical protein